jgi:hypothetical protein
MDCRVKPGNDDVQYHPYRSVSFNSMRRLRL